MTPPPTRDRERLASASKALERYVVDNGPFHDGECPGDDTCECSQKWINDGVNDACRLLEELRTSPPAPDLRAVVEEHFVKCPIAELRVPLGGDAMGMRRIDVRAAIEELLPALSRREAGLREELDEAVRENQKITAWKADKLGEAMREADTLRAEVARLTAQVERVTADVRHHTRSTGTGSMDSSQFIKGYETAQREIQAVVDIALDAADRGPR